MLELETSYYDVYTLLLFVQLGNDFGNARWLLYAHNIIIFKQSITKQISRIM